jgi:hypothetical protein
MKRTTIGIALIYCILVIFFQLTVFYTGHQLDPIGKFSKMICLVCMLPFILTAVYIKRKNNGGVIGGKEAVREGLYVAILSIAVIVLFEYIFYVTEFREYALNLHRNMTKEEVFKEAQLRDKNIKMPQALANHIVAMRYMRFSISEFVIPYLMFGMFSSFVGAVIMKRG